MSELKTLVYFDIEATGLKNSGRPRITEVSLVAVSTKDVLGLQSNLMNLIESKLGAEKILPRIINKLTICAYPMAIIRPEVSEITGLDNYNLSGQAPFNIKLVSFSIASLLTYRGLFVWWLTMVTNMTSHC